MNDEWIILGTIFRLEKFSNRSLIRRISSEPIDCCSTTSNDLTSPQKLSSLINVMHVLFKMTFYIPTFRYKHDHTSLFSLMVIFIRDALPSINLLNVI